MKTVLSAFLLSVFAFQAARSADAAPPAAPADAPAAPRPARRTLPPEAFTTPSNYVALVNVNFAVDQDWLEGQAAAMQRSLMVGVKAVSLETKGPLGPIGRDLAMGWFKTDPEAKILVILAQGEDLPPVLASPYEHWAVMDAGWVKRGGGDADLVNDRMGKRVYQALGACCGAAYHPEREAVMRYSPTPASLDNCLSHNFHPLNANAFSIVARAVGLGQIRLRPRSELIEMGLLQPRTKESPKTQDASPKPESEGSPD